MTQNRGASIMAAMAFFLGALVILSFIAQVIHDCGCWPALDQFLKRMTQ